MEKQQSFRLKKNRESAGKRGDKPLHLAARAANLIQVKEILKNSDSGRIKELLSVQNHDGETAMYVAAENEHTTVVSELLKFPDPQSATLKARTAMMLSISLQNWVIWVKVSIQYVGFFYIVFLKFNCCYRFCHPAILILCYCELKILWLAVKLFDMQQCIKISVLLNNHFTK